MQPVPFIKQRMTSFKNAFNGILIVLKKEVNFKIQLCIALLTVLLGFYVGLSPQEWLWITACSGSVLAFEAFNTAIERMVDLAEPNHNRLAGLIKDICAGAVLIASVTAMIIGLVIFIPKFFEI